MKNKPSDIPYCGVRRKAIKRANPVLNQKSLLYLYRFIKRRYRIHIRKDVQQADPPWTSDEVLQYYRFTNIRREHDKETRWVIRNIAKNKELSYEDKLLNIILFRLFNKHTTLELIEAPFKFDDWEPEWYRSVFEAAFIENPEFKPFSGAFYFSGTKRDLKRLTKQDQPHMAILYFVKLLHRVGVIDQIKAAENPQEVIEALSQYDGIGKFFAYQMFVDMTYIKKFPYSENEFVIAGIGCLKGLNLLFEDTDGLTPEECIFWLRDNLLEQFEQQLGKTFDPDKVFWDLPEYDRCFNVMSLENCLCELSKYIRAKTGSGRPRKRYNYD